MNTDSISIEYLSDNVTIEWLDNKRIAVLTVRSHTRKDFDVWADKLDELTRAWRGEYPFAVAHDAQLAFLSPHAQHRIKIISALGKELRVKGRYAVITGGDVLGQTFASFVNLTLRNKTGDDLNGRCFTSRDAALAWLREQF